MTPKLRRCLSVIHQIHITANIRRTLANQLITWPLTPERTLEIGQTKRTIHYTHQSDPRRPNLLPIKIQNDRAGGHGEVPRTARYFLKHGTMALRQGGKPHLNNHLVFLQIRGQRAKEKNIRCDPTISTHGTQCQLRLE